MHRHTKLLLNFNLVDGMQRSFAGTLVNQITLDSLYVNRNHISKVLQPQVR